MISKFIWSLKENNISSFDYDLMQIEIISWIEGYDDFVGRYISDALWENDFFLFINQIGDVIQYDKFHSLN